MPAAADAGYRAHARQHLAIRRAPARLVVLHQRGIRGDEQLLVVAEPRICRRRFQRAAREQPAGRQQHQRQRDLTDDHHVARREAPAEPRRAIRGQRLQIRHQVGLRQLQRGTQPRQHRRDDGEGGGRRDHAPVGRGLERDPERQHARERSRERARRPRREDEPAGRADEREQQTLGQQLADDAAARAADGEADGDLFAPCRAARQQHVRDVEARDEQHDRGEAHQKRRRTRRARVGRRRGARAEPRGAGSRSGVADGFPPDTPPRVDGATARRAVPPRSRASPRLQPPGQDQRQRARDPPAPCRRS